MIKNNLTLLITIKNHFYNCINKMFIIYTGKEIITWVRVRGASQPRVRSSIFLKIKSKITLQGA